MKYFLAVVLAYTLIECGLSQSIEMRVKEDKKVFKRDETVTLQCIVRHADSIPFGWVMDWHKVLSEGDEVTIGTNTNVDTEWRTKVPEHFQMTANGEQINGETVQVYTLVIKEVQYEDGGVYECKILPSGENYADRTEIAILKKPEKLTMEVDTGDGYYKNIAEQNEFQLMRNAEMKVKCTSTGGNPKSDLSIKVGDRLVDSIGESLRRSEAGNQRYGQVITFNVTETATIRVDSRLEDGTVICENLDDEGNVVLSKMVSVKLTSDGKGKASSCGVSIGMSMIAIVLQAIFLLYH